MTDDRDPLPIYVFRRNLVVVASAGTGKTHALVGAIVHLALGATLDRTGGLREPVPLSRVLATTFSRKAAAEIRARLERELSRLAVQDPASAYGPTLRAVSDRAGAPLTDEAISRRAAAALDEVPSSRIGTLHGYATALVRAHAALLGLSPRLTVEPEEDSAERARASAERAVEDILRDDAGGTGGLTRLFGGVGPLVERVASLVSRGVETGHDLASLALPAGDEHGIELTVETLLEHARGLVADKVLGDLAQGLVRAWEEGSPRRIEEAASRLTGAPARGVASDRAKSFFAFRATLPGATIGERGSNLIKLWKARETIAPQAALFRSLLVRTGELLEESSRRDAVMSYGQTLAAARALLRRDDVARAVGAGLDALLIDEFQDTSRIQRELVELLWSDPAADPGRAGLPAIGRVRSEGLLVVGDRKQSIYGFRGADVACFAELCIGLAGRPAREALRVPPGRVWEPEEPRADFVALRTNRRSRGAVLRFVNAYAQRSLVPLREPAELYEIDYSPPTEDLSPPSGDEDLEGAARAVSWIRLPPDPHARTKEAEAVARRIAHILAEKAPLVAGRAPTPRDIAVLSYRNAALEAVAYALAKARIPYVVAGNGFFSAKEVKDMLAMLAFLTDPTDTLARAVVLRGPFVGASDATLLALTDPEVGLTDLESWTEEDRWTEVDAGEASRVRALKDVAGKLRRVAHTLGPAEALRQAVRALAFEETLALLPRGEQRVANARKVIAMAEGEPSSSAFLGRMRRAVESERSEPPAATFSEDEDAVRLLTVHASKGLDFPLVLLPEAGAALGPVETSPAIFAEGSGGATIALRVLCDDGRARETPTFARLRADLSRRQVAERLRLSYVAATRAKEGMIFVGDRRTQSGASETFRSCPAAALATLADEGPELFDVAVGMDAPIAPLARSETAEATSTSERAAIAESEALEIDVRRLVDFSLCPRLFQLTSLVGLPAPGRGLGDERPGSVTPPYVTRAEGLGARVRRRLPFLGSVALKGSNLRRVTYRGVLDFGIDRGAGDREGFVVPGVETAVDDPRPRLVAEWAAHALAREKVRVGVLEPAGKSAVVVGRPRADLDRTAGVLAQAILEARRTGIFPRVARATCDSIACAYVSLCHAGGGAEDSETAIPPSAR